MTEVVIILVCITLIILAVLGYRIRSQSFIKKAEEKLIKKVENEFLNAEFLNVRSLNQNENFTEQITSIDPNIYNGLLRFMAMSRTSRCILSALHKADNPLSQDKLLVQINNNLSQKGNEPMTDNAYRRVLMILMGCYFVSMNENAEYSISTTGKKLFEIIKPIT